ncbi:MAG: hypothetical protein ACI80P_001169 [Flavobacteriales bacterium]|jgi:hypothetical protein
MKIRIKGNSLRLRLTKSEVSALAEFGKVEEATLFPNGKSLIYRLQAESTSTNTAAFNNSEIIISVPHLWAKEWAVNEDVGVNFNVATGVESLLVLIEKDFNCLTPRVGENEEDHFKNPLTSHTKC